MRRWAAGGLALMLIAMYPANVHKALSGEDLPWNELLIPRTILQLVFLAAVLIVLVYENRANFVVVEKYNDDGA